LKICADENVAPKLSARIREQLLSADFTLNTVDDHAARGVEDEIWVRKFADAGGGAIVGGDFNLTKKPHELVAIKETGLRLIVLNKRWPREKLHIQISYLFYWWPHIEEMLRSSTPGECLQVPWGWGETEGRICPIKIDLQRAQKQLKRARKRTK